MARTDQSSSVIGIDLGTTYSCVAAWKRDRVEIIPNAQGNRTTPSVVAFTDCDHLVGDAAKNQCHSNPNNTIFGVKRLIGRKFQDSEVQKQIKLLPFKVEAGENDKPRMVVQYKGERKTFYPEVISSMILSDMKSIAEAYLDTTVRNAVITVPAYFNDSQRRATKDAGTIAGLTVLRVINEPTAAALAYGFDKAHSADGRCKNVLIFDLGGGTFDVSILTMKGVNMEVKATGGDTFLGGEDMDDRMVNHLINEFKKRHRKDVSDNARAVRRLKTKCEKAKRMLSFSVETFIEVECLCDGIDLQYKFTRAKFEELNMDLFEKGMAVVRKCLDDAKMGTSDINDIVLVGGSTRIPKVQMMLSELFDGKELRKSVNPDEAVAYGAALQAALLVEEDSERLNDLVLLDVTPLSLGVSMFGDKMGVVIPRNTPIPVTKKETYYTVYDNRTSVMISVYEGERPMAKDNNLLGEFLFSGLPKARAGNTSLTVSFTVDANGILSVSAENEESRARKEVKIANERGRLSATEIKRMIEQAERFRLDDLKRKERAESRSRLEAFIANARARMRNSQMEENSHLKNKLEKNLHMASIWLEDNLDAEALEMERKREQLEKEFDSLPLN